MQVNIAGLKNHLDILYAEKREAQNVLKKLAELYECAITDPTNDISFIKNQESACRQQLEHIQRRIDLLTETVDNLSVAQQRVKSSLDSAIRQVEQYFG